jgi:hypothetical protein
MPAQASDEQLGNALLQSVEHGAFPQDEQVASAAVPSSALPKLLEVVSQAREDTKVTMQSRLYTKQSLTLCPGRSPQTLARSRTGR